MLKFEFSVEETNLILAALSKQPFETVFGIIKKLQDQATPQLQKQAAPPEPEKEIK